MKNRTLVFTAGEKPDYTYSNAEVKQIAENYTETQYSAPWVLGHSPKPGSPAAGWIRGLEYEEDAGVGHLYAVSDFNALGENCISSKEYENKSVSLYVPDSPFNPNPGEWSLRHIAMLGAEPPVLKNLGPIAVIEYSEEETETDYVLYACACEAKTNLNKEYMEPTLEELKAEIAELKAEIAAAKVEEVIEDAVEETAPKEDKEMAALKEELAKAYAELNVSKEANMALTVSSAIAPYYSEGVITEDALPEATLTNVVTKLTLGLTNYSETENPLTVIEALLQVVSTNVPASPEYGETWENTDHKAPEKSVYDSGDSLHDLASSTSKEYGLSYGQALSAVVEAQELASVKAINFSECLSQTIKGYRK
jgi:hypothetical protein